jgi:hypothetical protein
MTEAVFDVCAVLAAAVPWLAAATVLPAGNSQPPADGTFPFTIVYALPLGSQAMSTLADVETVWPLKLQVTSVGKAPAQAQMCGARVARAMAGKDTSGAYLVAAPALPAVTVIRREADRDGHAQDGDGLYEWAETFTWWLHLL